MTFPNNAIVSLSPKTSGVYKTKLMLDKYTNHLDYTHELVEERLDLAYQRAFDHGDNVEFYFYINSPSCKCMYSVTVDKSYIPECKFSSY